MKRLIRFTARMYPRSWRSRYGQEFEALLDALDADGRTALNVLGGAVLMQIQRSHNVCSLGLLTVTALLAASWWTGQRPYITPGTHQVFRQDSTLGAIAGLLVFLTATIVGLVSLVHAHDRRFREAARAGRLCVGIFLTYLSAVVLVSLATPRTIVSLGDSYCWDLWCLGIQHVDAMAQGQNVLYQVEVSIFCDSNKAHRVPFELAKSFFYVRDEQGRRFPLFKDLSFVDDTVVEPGQSARSSLTFLVPARARKLYLGADDAGPPWVSFYFGSDIAPFHRHTLLRIF